MLSQKVKQNIKEAVALAGNILKLEPTKDHPERNSYAHLWRTIKNTMGKSYYDCNDNDEKKILDIVKQELNKYGTVT